jgi:hypothetical protein
MGQLRRLRLRPLLHDGASGTEDVVLLGQAEDEEPVGALVVLITRASVLDVTSPSLFRELQPGRELPEGKGPRRGIGAPTSPQWRSLQPKPRVRHHAFAA